MSQWHRPGIKRPEEGQHVAWIDSAGTESHGRYHSRHWWLSVDMYIYCEPQFWRPLSEDDSHASE